MDGAKKILIVEEERAVAQALVRRLTARGYAPQLAVEPEAAVNAFDELRPDLVVVSLTLPEDGGRRVCRGIRTRRLGALVPILFVGTGAEDIQSVGEAIAAGADHFFRKPEGVDELVGKVTTYIGPGRETPAPEGEPARADANEVYATINEVLARRQAEELPADEEPRGPDWQDLEEILQEDTPPPNEAEPDPGGEFGWTLPEEEAEAQPFRPPKLDEPEPAPPPAPRERPGAEWRPAEPPAPDFDAAWLEALQIGRALPLERRGMGTILAAADRVHLSGRVEVAAAGVLRRVFFDEGRPVYADSSARTEDLVAHLAAEGRVARGALSRARQRATAAGASPEEVLIEAGLLDADEVYRALRGHVIDRILALFALEAGEAIVFRGGPRPLDPVDLGLHPGRLVLDGVRRKYGRLRLYRVFGTASAVPRPQRGEAPPTGLVLRPDEEAVWKSCDGRRSVVDVARAAHVGEVDALAILHGLTVLDLVEAPSGRPVGPLPALQNDAVARAGAPRTADQMPGYPDLVGAKFAEIATADYYQVLGVPRGVTSAELRAAWETLRRRFDPHRVRRDSSLWHQVNEIAAVVDDAYTMLSEERTRRLYERAVS